MRRILDFFLGSGKLHLHEQEHGNHRLEPTGAAHTYVYPNWPLVAPPNQISESFHDYFPDLQLTAILMKCKLQ